MTDTTPDREAETDSQPVREGELIEAQLRFFMGCLLAPLDGGRWDGDDGENPGSSSR